MKIIEFGLKDGTSLRDINGSSFEITTPYLDRHNDAPQIYARRENGGFVLTDGQAIEVHATTENFPARKHNLVQAMLAVSYLFYLAKPVVESLFYEDVIEWLDANDVRYTPKA